MLKFETQKAIENFYFANVATQLPEGTKTFFDNQNGSGTSNSALWLRHSVQEIATEFSALGKDESRTVGQVQIQIFTKKGSGSQLSNQTADLLDVYSGARTGCVHFTQPPNKAFSGVIGDWFQTTIYIQFYSDEKRS